MEVREFVAETLAQVTAAINEHESTFQNGRGNVEDLKKINMFSHYGQCVTYVDFDIAVTESSSQEGGAELSVAGVGGFGGVIFQPSQFTTWR
jgi:hypothetical protein